MMYECTANTFDEWRKSARRFLTEAVPPQNAYFRGDSVQRGLFGDDARHGNIEANDVPTARFRVPRRFMELARKAACHRDSGRFELLYRVLWRLTHGEPNLLDIATDDDVHRLHVLEKAVRRDAHKMKAFVRFRRVVENGREQFIAWHRPDHRIVRLVAPFFARRFPTMCWTILTPDESVSWAQPDLFFGDGVPAGKAPRSDELEDLWRTYYASIFNPARVKVKAMIREMPVRHWQTLPETVLIPDLLAQARERVSNMIEIPVKFTRSATDYMPREHSYEALRDASSHCQGCELHCHATQTVFGEGPTSARLMLVGEQPGDVEDREGLPFVGPAGKVLDDAMQAAGIDRQQVYMTNAVKHFKFVLRGKRRIHNKPSIQEAIACRPWLEAEIGLVQPNVLVCLGATAAQALMGTDFRITKQRGQFFETPWCKATLATYHPSAVLRTPDATHSRQIFSDLVADLASAACHR